MQEQLRIYIYIHIIIYIYYTIGQFFSGDFPWPQKSWMVRPQSMELLLGTPYNPYRGPLQHGGYGWFIEHSIVMVQILSVS